MYLKTASNISRTARLRSSILATVCCLFFAIPAFSQTIYEAPVLTCVRNLTTAPASTELNWTVPSTVSPCFSAYEIYGSTGSADGPYTLLATINNPLQTSAQIFPPAVPIYNGSTATITHFYMLQRGSCVNPAAPLKATSDTLNNEKPQPFVAIERASIIGNQVHLSWYPSKSTEVIGYLIYNDKDGFTTPDTVLGRLNNSYIDIENDPSLFTIRYKIRAYEFCENGVGLQGSQTPDSADHRTMLAQVAEPDKCTQTATVSWQPYKIGSASVVTYEIQRSINGGAFSVDGVTDAATTNFLLRDLPFRDTVCIRIKANLPNGSFAYSNERCFSADVIKKPVSDYIRNISVVNGEIVIEYKVDTSAAPAKTIILQRSNDGIVFTPVINTPDFPDANTMIFTEPGLRTDAQTYTYRVNLLDSCNITHSSDTATTIRLGIKVKSNNKADILWSGFAIENSIFQYFQLEKISGTDTTVVGNFNRNQTSYAETDLFDYSKDSLDIVCYRVTAYFINNNDKAPRATLQSYSNIVCVTPEPKAFAPQAFAPNGYNKTFRPFLLYALSDFYDFKIYDRWHQLVFSTNDVNSSWDGQFNGEPAPSDAYTYIIKFRGKNNQDYTQTGTVMLLR